MQTWKFLKHIHSWITWGGNILFKYCKGPLYLNNMCWCRYINCSIWTIIDILSVFWRLQAYYNWGFVLLNKQPCPRLNKYTLCNNEPNPKFVSSCCLCRLANNNSNNFFIGVAGPPNPENVPEDGKLKSEMMIKDNRRYYLDLKENSRGRFLRVSKV